MPGEKRCTQKMPSLISSYTFFASVFGLNCTVHHSDTLSAQLGLASLLLAVFRTVSVPVIYPLYENHHGPRDRQSG